MKRLILTALIAIGCGAAPDVAETSQATVTAPWLCSPQTYSPDALPYQIGWCAWQPSANTDPIFLAPQGIGWCFGEPPAGSADFYDNESPLLAHCARVSILPGQADRISSRAYTTKAGWNTAKVQTIKGGIRLILTQVRAMSIGPHTEVIWDEGEISPGGGCSAAGHCVGTGSFDDSAAHMLGWSAAGFPGFAPASFYLHPLAP